MHSSNLIWIHTKEKKRHYGVGTVVHKKNVNTLSPVNRKTRNSLENIKTHTQQTKTAI